MVQRIKHLPHNKKTKFGFLNCFWLEYFIHIYLLPSENKLRYFMPVWGLWKEILLWNKLIKNPLECLWLTHGTSQVFPRAISSGLNPTFKTSKPHTCESHHHDSTSGKFHTKVHGQGQNSGSKGLAQHTWSPGAHLIPAAHTTSVAVHAVNPAFGK